MKTFLIKLKTTTQQANDEQCSVDNGRIIVNRKQVVCHEYPLAEKNFKNPLENRKFPQTIILSMHFIKIFIGNSEALPTAIVSPANEAGLTPLGTLGTSPNLNMALNVPNTVSAATSLGEYTMPERNFWQGKYNLMLLFFSTIN